MHINSPVVFATFTGISLIMMMIELLLFNQSRILKMKLSQQYCHAMEAQRHRASHVELFNLNKIK